MARAPATAADHEGATALLNHCWAVFRDECGPARWLPPDYHARVHHDDGVDGIFPLRSAVTHDLVRDVDTDARVTSVGPRELVVALDAAPRSFRVVFPADVALAVRAGDALHVLRRTRRVADRPRHDLIVSDAAGMLVLVVSDTGDRTLLPGWEIAPATDTPGTRFDHRNAWTEWRRITTRDGVYELLATGGVIEIVRTAE